MTNSVVAAPGRKPRVPSLLRSPLVAGQAAVAQKSWSSSRHTGFSRTLYPWRPWRIGIVPFHFRRNKLAFLALLAMSLILGTITEMQAPPQVLGGWKPLNWCSGWPSHLIGFFAVCDLWPCDYLVFFQIDRMPSPYDLLWYHPLPNLQE